MSSINKMVSMLRIKSSQLSALADSIEQAGLPDGVAEVVGPIFDALVPNVNEAIYTERLVAQVNSLKDLAADALAQAAKSSVAVESGLVFVPPLTSGVIQSILEGHENIGAITEGLVMSAKVYAGVRRFGREDLEIETRLDVLRVGGMGRMWGAWLIVDKNIPTDQIVSVGIDDKNNRSYFLHTNVAAA